MALSAVSPANAADLPPGPLPPVAYTAIPVYSWTGIYVGANAGGAWANGSVTDSLFGQTWSTTHSLP